MTKVDSSNFIPAILLILLCTAGCAGLTEKTFFLPEGTPVPPLTALWDGAVEVTGIEKGTGMMSGFDLIMGRDGRVVLLDLRFSGEVNGERRHFNAYLDQQGRVTVKPIPESLFQVSHPDRIFRDLEAVASCALFGENEWTVHLKQSQNVTYDHANIAVYLMDNGTLIPLDWVSTASTEAPVFYLSVCNVSAPDLVVTTAEGSGAGINSGGGSCFILFTPEELEKASYKKEL